MANPTRCAAYAATPCCCHTALQLFSVQGSLSAAQAAAVAARAGCTADEALALFQELRRSTKKQVRRAVHRAAEAAAATAATAAAAAAVGAGGDGPGEVALEEASQRVAAEEAARQAAAAKLRGMLDAAGGLRDASVTGERGPSAGAQQPAASHCGSVKSVVA
jgi:hypothetical protein